MRIDNVIKATAEALGLAEGTAEWHDLANALQTAYDLGHDAGYQIGVNEGYADGYHEGETDGLNEGFGDALEYVNR